MSQISLLIDLRDLHSTNDLKSQLIRIEKEIKKFLVKYPKDVLRVSFQLQKEF